MVAMTKEELQKLLDKLKDDSQNVDLINRIAIGYLENPSVLQGNEDLKFFELAYKTKKTIKSAHNFAWFLYTEKGEEDKAIEVQKDCISLKPKTFYPYYLLGFMLLEKKKYDEAIQYLSIAREKSNRRDILHNLAFCHYKLGNLELSLNLFEQASSQDSENKSAFNQAVICFKLNRTDELKKIANKLNQSVNCNFHNTISQYEIGFLYFLLENYAKSTECLIKQGINGVDLNHWKELSYSLFVTDKQKWISQQKKSIQECKESILEINTNPEEWDFDSEKEKNEELEELKNKITQIQKIVSNGISKPDINLEEYVWADSCGCLLFGCKRHENQLDDDFVK